MDIVPSFLSMLMLFLASFVVVTLLIPVIIKLSHKWNLLDTPNQRKSHKQATPILGGVSFYIAFWVSYALSFSFTAEIIGLFLGSTLLLIVGVYDDVKHVSPSIKLLSQIIAGTIVYMFGLSISFISHPVEGFYYLDFLKYPITVFWIVGLINTVNLVDGLDGLASGISSISITCLLLVTSLTQSWFPFSLLLILLAICLAFLRYNFYPAKIFMGDTGAMFLGFMIASISIMGVVKEAAVLSLVVPILALGLPIWDVVFTVFRRIKNKKKVFLADNDHFHHRLLKLGLNHKQSVYACYILTLILSVFAVFVSILSGLKLLVFFCFILLAIFLFYFLLKKNPSKLFAFINLL